MTGQKMLGGYEFYLGDEMVVQKSIRNLKSRQVSPHFVASW